MVKHLIHLVIAHEFVHRGDSLEPSQGGAELGLAHRALPREDRSHRPELKVQGQNLAREAANRLDQINHDFSFGSVHRHKHFSIAPAVAAREEQLPSDLNALSSNLCASDGLR